MIFKLIIKPRAELDTIEAVIWYNTMRDGLGNEFLLTLDAKLNEIIRNPFQYPVFYKSIHRGFTERFPYGVYFTVDGNEVYIHAIVHTSRNPKILKKRY